MAERVFWLAWSQVPGVGSILIQRLHQHFGTLSTAWKASFHELQAVEGIGEQNATTIVKERHQIDPELLYEQHVQTNPDFWIPIDADYPRWLLEIPDPPPVLYYRGEVNLLENQGIVPSVAIVGTRGPSDYGRRWARRISTTLAQMGFSIVSGLAEGIDTEVHQSCLGVGGRTIAVLGTGVDVVYPHFNQKLAEQIQQQGLLVSEFPATTQPDRTHFPRRNRIIAGLCRATLVIEAPKKSGSLITARLANEYGREVYALPGTLDNYRAQGCLHLLSQGAQMILNDPEWMETLSALLQMDAASQLSAPGTQQLSLLNQTAPQPEPVDLPPELLQVLSAVALEPVAVDAIVETAGLATGAVLSALSQLELLGLVSQLPGMRYQRD